MLDKKQKKKFAKSGRKGRDTKQILTFYVIFLVLLFTESSLPKPS
jgi:hypothetical protein